MAKALKNRASKQHYISSSQPLLPGFETPFAKQLSASNRCVTLAHKIPWDDIVHVYGKQMGNQQTGAEGINPRVVIGSLIIKHMCDLSDRETVQQIQENMYMQYFIGYTSFSDEVPFDPSLFVEFRKRMGVDQINAINEKILHLSQGKESNQEKHNDDQPPPSDLSQEKEHSVETSQEAVIAKPAFPTHGGKLILDAMACPQNIEYPTDLNLLNDAREKSEELIDFLYTEFLGIKKPRTYRKNAHKFFLKTAQKRSKSKKEIRWAIKKQLGYVKRNIKNIHILLDHYQSIPLDHRQHKYLF